MNNVTDNLKLMFQDFKLVLDTFFIKNCKGGHITPTVATLPHAHGHITPWVGQSGFLECFFKSM